jgi:hypothetical protein
MDIQEVTAWQITLTESDRVDLLSDINALIAEADSRAIRVPTLAKLCELL